MLYVWVPTAQKTYHIEHCGEGPANVIERHSEVLQSEVVESDHSDEDDRQRKDLSAWENKIGCLREAAQCT